MKQSEHGSAARDRGHEKASPLVRLNGCSVRLAGREVLSGVNLTLCQGQGWAVLGGNGAGKSTLLRLLRGDIWPVNPDCRTFFDPLDGQPSASPIGFRERTALVSAEMAEEYRRLDHPLTGRECALTGLSNSRFLTGPVGPEHSARVEELFQELGIADLLERPVAAMSEGQAKAVLLVRALAAGPAVLLLDEAFDGLDARRRARATDLVAGLAAAGTTLVQATHRPEEIAPVLTRGLFLEQGTVSFAGELEQAVRAYAGLSRSWPGQASCGEERVSGTAARNQPPIVELRGVSVALAGKIVLRDVDFALRPGEWWTVAGPNGAGKSTLLKVLAGDLHPLPSGLVLRHGRPGPHDLWQVRRETGFVSAEAQAWHDLDATGLDVVVSGFHGSVGLHAPPEPGEVEAAMDLLDGAGLRELADARFGRMSFGQRRGLLILRAMVHRPRALLLDEPLSGLDLASRQEMRIFLAGLRASGVALVMSSHHEEDLPDLSGGPNRLGGLLRLEAGRAQALCRRR